MDRLAFTALGAITNQDAARAQITNNLANISTVGFKESFAMASKSMDVEGDGFNSRAAVTTDTNDMINLSPGVSNRTGRAMDVALQGSTVLGVQAQNGEIGFPRRGDRRGSETGVIENAAGNRVMGEEGTLNVRTWQHITSRQDGAMW